MKNKINADIMRRHSSFFTLHSSFINLHSSFFIYKSSFFIYMFPIVFALGIFTAYEWIPAGLFWYVLGTNLLSIGIVAIVTRKISYNTQYLNHTTLIPVFLTAASLTLAQKIIQQKETPKSTDTYDMVIASEPSHGKYGTHYNAIITEGYMTQTVVRISLSHDLTGAETLKPGDGIRIKSQLKVPQEKKESHFNYALHLKTQGISFIAFAGKGDAEGIKPNIENISAIQQIRLGALMIRHNLLNRLKQTQTTDNTLAILSAMTLGEKSGISDDIRDTYSISGTSHMLALSGTHLALIFYLLSIFSRGKNKRWHHVGIELSVLWLYIILVGMPASAVRAGTMLSIYSITTIAGRTHLPLHTLGVAATIMMALCPYQLFDIGFQLSVLAVLAIILSTKIPIKKPSVNNIDHSRLTVFFARLKRPLLRYLYINMFIFLFTAPLVAYYFGRIPVYFLIANAITTPAVAAIVYLGLATIALSPLPIIGTAITMAANLLISMLNTFLACLSSLPYSTIGVSHMSRIALILIYAIIGSTLGYIFSTKSSKIC